MALEAIMKLFIKHTQWLITNPSTEAPKKAWCLFAEKDGKIYYINWHGTYRGARLNLYQYRNLLDWQQIRMFLLEKVDNKSYKTVVSGLTSLVEFI